MTLKIFLIFPTTDNTLLWNSFSVDNMSSPEPDEMGTNFTFSKPLVKSFPPFIY